MMAIYGPLQLILSVVYFMMIIHIIMSWLINFQVLNLHQQTHDDDYGPPLAAVAVHIDGTLRVLLYALLDVPDCLL